VVTSNFIEITIELNFRQIYNNNLSDYYIMPPKKKVKKVTKKVTKKTSQKVEQHTNVNIKIGDTAKPKRVYKKRTVTSKPEPKQNGNPYNNLIETRYVPQDNSKQIIELVKHLAETKTHPIPHMPANQPVISQTPNPFTPYRNRFEPTTRQYQFAKDFQKAVDDDNTSVSGISQAGSVSGSNHQAEEKKKAGRKKKTRDAVIGHEYREQLLRDADFSSYKKAKKKLGDNLSEEAIYQRLEEIVREKNKSNQ
jgi:hypothetical protein